MKKQLTKSFFGLLLVLILQQSYAQDQGVFSGNFESNFNVFLRDSLISANNTPQYDRQLTGGEAWLNLNYSIKGYNMGIRFDMFNNSNLLNPTGSYTGQGIGRWFINKQINKLNIEVGYIYDQIGSGIIYRAWESRPLLIDNALLGAKVEYNINDNWKIKGFSGKQKFLFDVNPGIIKGGSIDGFISLGNEESPISLSPGIGFVNRTLSDESMNKIISNVKTYLTNEQITPVYNTYLTTLYNTLSYKSITWYVEGAYKSPEAFFDSTEPRTEPNGKKTFGKFRKEAGSILYTSLSYAKGKLGVTVEGKRTENFNFRSDPNLSLNRGLINYIPPMNRLNTYRLTARYAPATQDLSELAYQADVRYRFSKKINAHANYSNITELDGNLLYREILAEIEYKYKRAWKITGGLQLQKYNQQVYEVKPEVPLVSTVTPYLDFLYKLTRKKSIRFETQYMATDQDFGSWWFGLIELGLAPHWIFESSIMYNIKPSKKSPKNPDTGESLNIIYPTLGVVYVNKSNRFSLRYVKQVEGIVCSGGICRLEPAFSGVKFSIASNF
ncbi:MAG: DUF6029 family protein [Saprospiraceae bacterium]